MTRVAITVISFPKVESSCEVAMFPFLAPRPNRVVKWSWHVVARIRERKNHFVRYNQFQWKPRRISTPWCALRARVTPPRSSAAGGAGRLGFSEKRLVTALNVSDICASDARQVAT